METLKMNYNSTENKEIKGKFVRREVLTCFSYEMQDCLEKEVVSYDDIENVYEYVCNECGEASETDVCDDDNCNGSCDYEPQEIFEWYIVTEYLYSKLKEKGQPVLAWGNNYYWGRCCTGQAILLDSVISEICEEMEILQGQKYDWSK